MEKAVIPPALDTRSLPTPLSQVVRSPHQLKHTAMLICGFQKTENSLLLEESNSFGAEHET